MTAEIVIDVKTLNEICICAAIRMPDGEVIRGHRHNNCYDVVRARANAPENRENICAAEQGFVTSLNRFVNREQGMVIQRASGLRSHYSADGSYNGDALFSEDLYPNGPVPELINHDIEARPDLKSLRDQISSILDLMSDDPDAATGCGDDQRFSNAVVEEIRKRYDSQPKQVNARDIGTLLKQFEALFVTNPLICCSNCQGTFERCWCLACCEGVGLSRCCHARRS